MHTLGSAPDLKGREAHFQDFAYVLVLKEVGRSEELLVQKGKKYSLGTFSSGRRLHTIPYLNRIREQRISVDIAPDSRQHFTADDRRVPLDL